MFLSERHLCVGPVITSADSKNCDDGVCDDADVRAGVATMMVSNTMTGKPTPPSLPGGRDEVEES